MSPFRGSRRLRLPMALLSLGLFVYGNSYCLLSASSGMACMTVPAGTARTVCSHCGAAPKAPRAPERTAGRSCCPAPVVMPAQIALDAGTAAATPLPALLAVPPADDSPQFTSTWFGHPPLHDGQPPTALVRALLAARAPPLS